MPASPLLAPPLATIPAPRPRPAPAIEVDRLRKTYPGGVEAVKGISFEVAPGEVFGLLGPNGAGKSTTVGMLTTTIASSEGRVLVGGFDVAREPRAARLISSVVFQDPVVDRSLTGRRNLDLHARLWRVGQAEAPHRIAELAVRFGLADVLDRPVATYSGGQRRRLELARALVSNPKLLFLDEPTVGLDPRIRAELLDLIAAVRDRWETTILLTTHYLDEAERLCDRIAIMHEGKIVAHDTPEALRATLGEQIVELRLHGNASGTLATLRRHGIAGADAFSIGGTITIPLHDRSTREATAGIDALAIEPASLTTRRPTLDDVYLRLTGGRLGAE
jgi:ABC-2 type transport system ATP-binding protein